ncbi:Hydrolase [Amycolatopsis camponoti]|uniref:Hydrolase n=1 Tax=Amycolatopsis camponoti TaxID=2606593 RepID=A0A6I8LPY9_9PSEU|nr:alpha/beta hydrolase [Amycolatopsis camponoti]VVJ17199.1 Hydrolase [Amycolatopsis camponoti]
MDTGTHTVELDGVRQRYHVHGRGPVCVALPGGPGVDWAYLRMPALEAHLTVVYVEPIGTGGSGRLASHPHGYTRARYARALLALLDHLGVATAHLIGHSHGGFVAQYFALHRPDRVAGVVLYESAPVTGPEHGAEAQRNVEEFARRNADRPDLPGVLAALQATASISDDDEMDAALRGLLPAYFADYWGREAEFAPLRATVRGTHISGLDERLVPDTIDDRAALGSLTVPALVVAGRFDVICGVRWARELVELIPDARLVVLERSGHFGHLEEPAVFAEAVAGFVIGS